MVGHRRLELGYGGPADLEGGERRRHGGALLIDDGPQRDEQPRPLQVGFLRLRVDGEHVVQLAVQVVVGRQVRVDDLWRPHVDVVDELVVAVPRDGGQVHHVLLHVAVVDPGQDSRHVGRMGRQRHLAHREVRRKRRPDPERLLPADMCGLPVFSHDVLLLDQSREPQVRRIRASPQLPPTGGQRAARPVRLPHYTRRAPVFLLAPEKDLRPPSASLRPPSDCVGWPDEVLRPLHASLRRLLGRLRPLFMRLRSPEAPQEPSEPPRQPPEVPPSHRRRP